MSLYYKNREDWIDEKKNPGNKMTYKQTHKNLPGEWERKKKTVIAVLDDKTPNLLRDFFSLYLGEL